MHHQQQQQQYWQNQAHPNARYPPNQYTNHYPVQNAQKPPPVFRSQAELGFELPPVRPSVAVPVQQQQRPMSMGPPPVPSQMQRRPRPQSVGYPQPNPGFAPPMRGPALPPQLARSSSASPTRKPLPAPANPGARPLTVTQSSGFVPLPPNRPQTMDLSAFSRFNQERMASGAISPSAVRNSNPGQAYPNAYAPQQQQQSPMVAMSNRSPSSTFTSPPMQHPSSPNAPYTANMTTPTRRRASPPRFFGNTSAGSSRDNSPEKANYNSQTSTPTKSQPVYSRNPPNPQPPLPRSTPLQSRPQYDPNPPPPTSSYQSAAPSSSTFATTASTAVRHRNPIFEPQSAVSPTETKFVPLWKRSSIAKTGGGSSREMERSMTMPPATPSRPLPQPSPSRFSQYTVEEPEDEEANRSFESASESSAVSTAPSANSQMSGAGNGPGILDLRGNLPQPPKTGRAAASISALPKATHGGGGSRFDEMQTPLPPPMDRAAATTGVIHEGGSGSMTLRFAKMGLDGAGNGAPWPQDLPPLPRGPGSGFTNSKPFSRPQSSHSQSSSSPRHSHSHSQPQSHSAFASVSPANAAPRGRTERIGPDYDLDEPPPRPASTSFSARSVSPAGSTASSTTGVLERFRRNAQPQAQPQPQYPGSAGGYSGHGGVKIESPAPLGGKEKRADVRRMESDSRRNSEYGGVSRIPHGDSDDTYDRRDKPEVPRITFGGDEEEDVRSGPMIRVSGEVSGLPRITFGDDESDDDGAGSSSGPMIRVSGEEVSKPNPPQIVFEVPGVGVGPQFGSGPVINVSGDDDEDHNTPRRTPAPSQHRQGGPRGISSARSQINGGGSQTPSRGKGGLTCPACGKPIVGRIVGAMGMKWHPDCFRCTICDELLEFQSSYEGVGEDGIKRPYCHLDYHETFAPKCYHCKTAIVEERFISLNDPALGRRTYHEPHFFCAECGDPFLSPSSAATHNLERDLGKNAGGELSFSGDGTFSYDDEDDNVGFTVYKGHPYCEACHVRLRLPKCKRCKRPIRDHTEAVEALGGKWCWECFRCTNCDRPFDDPSFFERDKKPYCENCFSIIIRNEI